MIVQSIMRRRRQYGRQCGSQYGNGRVAAACALLAFLLAGFGAALLPLIAVQAQAQSGISSPAAGSAVSGDVAVMGTAVIEPFQKYELHYKLEPSGDDAFIYFQGGTTPVTNGPLGVWQAGGLAPGVYSLRLRVVKNDGNYAEFFSRNLNVNLGPVEPSPTPTSSEPTPTPIPTATFTPAPQPTPIVGQVAQPSTLDPTPTPEAIAAAPPAAPQTDAANPALPAADGASGAVVAGQAAAGSEEATIGSTTRELGEALSLGRLRERFLTGVRFSAALFFGIAAVYAAKRVLGWAWTQFT